MRDEGEEEQPAEPGQTQGQLLHCQHCIKPIIHYQRLFWATVNVLFTWFKKHVANGVSSTAERDSREIVNMFFSSLPTGG